MLSPLEHHQVPTYWELCLKYLRWNKWEEKVSLWPRKCPATDKILWLEKAMRGQRAFCDGVEYHWISKETYVFEKLKGVL
jgi:hypothetical protein